MLTGTEQSAKEDIIDKKVKEIGNIYHERESKTLGIQSSCHKIIKIV